MPRKNVILSFLGFLAICVVALSAFIFFDFQNIANDLTLNAPFQSRWVAIQLTDGEILYGHLAGVSDATIGLSDVYVLEKFAPAPTTDVVSPSTDFSLGETPSLTPPAQLVPVKDSGSFFVNRAAVLYFKILSPDDPALPALH